MGFLIILTYWPLVMPCVDTKLDEQWFRLWLAAVTHWTWCCQAISWSNVESLSVRSCDLPQDNFAGNAQDSSYYIVFVNELSEVTVTSSRGQCVNGSTGLDLLHLGSVWRSQTNVACWLKYSIIIFHIGSFLTHVNYRFKDWRLSLWTVAVFLGWQDHGSFCMVSVYFKAWRLVS